MEFWKTDEQRRQESKAKKQVEAEERDRQLKAIHANAVNSGLALEEYSDEQLKQLMEIGLLNMERTKPGAWTKLALTLTGRHGSNETINTLEVIIRQNWVMMIQNEMLLREMRKSRAANDKQAED